MPPTTGASRFRGGSVPGRLGAAPASRRFDRQNPLKGAARRADHDGSDRGEVGVIDVEQFEEQLDLALTDELRSAIGLATAPAPVAPTRPERSGRTTRPRHQEAPRTPRSSAKTRSARPASPPPGPAVAPTTDIPSLLRAGRVDEADRLIAAQHVAAEAHGSTLARRDAALWTTMQALRDGRAVDARAGTRTVRTLSLAAADPRADDRYWGQQFWIVLDWGDESERYELLDQCRERAYGHDDVAWRSALALLCARLGRTDEAVREFDATTARIDGIHNGAPDALGIVTNLAEAAALLGDPARATSMQRCLTGAKGSIVFDDHMCVVRGAVARPQALVAAATHQWAAADQAFQIALDAHRRIGALPLVARTLYEWAMTLTTRGDPRAWELLSESTGLARTLGMTGRIAGMP
jgi:hypothetical protein